MKVSVSFRQLNTGYNPQMQVAAATAANANRKYSWEESLKVSGNVKEMNVIENGDFVYKVRNDDGREMPFRIPNMHILQCFMDSGDIKEYAVSSSLVDAETSVMKNLGYKAFYFFNLNGSDDYIRPTDGVIIATADFPEELMMKERA